MATFATLAAPDCSLIYLRLITYASAPFGFARRLTDDCWRSLATGLKSCALLAAAGNWVPGQYSTLMPAIIFHRPTITRSCCLGISKARAFCWFQTWAGLDKVLCSRGCQACGPRLW